MITSLVIFSLNDSLINRKGVSKSYTDFIDTLLSFSFSSYGTELRILLLALMSVLSKSLLALVSSHLVALLLFSVWHNLKILM